MVLSGGRAILIVVAVGAVFLMQMQQRRASEKFVQRLKDRKHHESHDWESLGSADNSTHDHEDRPKDER